MALSIVDLLKEVVERKASDLHIAPGSPPRLRINGDLIPIEGYGILSPTDTKQLIYSVLTDFQKKKLEEI
nr:hypothetical protein [Desulfurobacterium thermolithotrophum]